MSLRDQPYLPLYVQDFLTDEKLIECSAAAHGIYIKIMCLMHKSSTYGKLQLRNLPNVLPQQNEQQNKIFADLFAAQLAKHLPFDKEEICRSIFELLTENVLFLEVSENVFLCQKRMIKDNELSIKRSKSGKLGADVTNKMHKDFAAAKSSANAEYENEYKEEKESVREKEEKKTEKLSPEMTKDDFLNFQSKLIQDALFIEPLMSGKGIREKADMLGWIKYFNVHIVTEYKIKKDYYEYRKHFRNWILKWDTTKPPPLNGNSPVVAIPKIKDGDLDKYRKNKINA